MFPLANIINGSSTLRVAVLTVTVSPLTVKSPAMVTSSGSPIVTVPAASTTVTSLVVPEKVMVPPKATGEVFEPSLTVMEELANIVLLTVPLSVV